MNNSKRLSLIFVFAILGIVFHQEVCAQAGILDPSFNLSGIVKQDIAGKNDYGFATAIQADGKILIAGFGNLDTIDYNDFVLLRYQTNGQLDSTFGVNGRVTTHFFSASDDEAHSLCIQGDGKIIVAGKTAAPGNFYDFALARFNANGSLDSSFGGDGKVTTDIAGFNDYGASAKLQTDGKIVMTGYTYNGMNTALAILRYNSDGSLDTGFDIDGISLVQEGDIYLNGQSLALQANGKIVACATSKFPGNEYDILVARLNSNGSLDSTFGGDGIIRTDFCYHDDALAIAIQNDGRIVVAGSSYDTVNITMGKNLMLIRYLENGWVDSSFGMNGKVITEVTTQADKAFTLAIQPNGKIIAAGHSSDGVSQFKIILTRYLTNGSLDMSFGGSGLVTTNIASYHEFGEGIALQADGKIVVTGFASDGISFDMFVARYIGDPVYPNGVTYSEDSFTVSLAPNPWSSSTRLTTNRLMNQMHISVYDAQGRKLTTMKNLSGYSVLIERRNWPPGWYWLCLSEDNKVIGRFKLLLQH